MRQEMCCTVLGILVVFAVVVPAQGQSEGDLRDYFEGRRVVVLVDMPADESGINIKVDNGRSIDRNDVGRDLGRYGVAIRKGDPAEITLIKKKGKHIEFQLDGGGWKGRHNVALGYKRAPKSKRHEDIEAELALLPDPLDKGVSYEEKKLRLRSILEKDLEDMNLQYEADNANRLADAREIQSQAQEALDHRILNYGSRFNLRFDRKVPSEALTPEGLAATLEKYVEFLDESVTANK